MAIEVQHLSHTYKGGFQALDDVNLSFGTGVFGLLGPNGAGKSTLMRILCTLTQPQQGQVTIGGHDVVEDPMAVRALLGYLPQGFGAWRNHRVSEVLDTLALLSGMLDRKTRRDRTEEILEQVGLADVGRRKVKKLSGGMLRRLGVAQALMHRPQVIIVDEPTVGLDPEERIRFRNVITELGRDRTILLSTHIVADLGGACRELALLDQGHIIFQGTPSELISSAIGQVFELAVDEAGLDHFEQQYDIVSATPADGRISLRGVTSGDLPEGATQVSEPTLEEGYMAWMGARGRSDAAREDNTQEAAA